MSTYKMVDLANWKRTMHYQIFRGYAEPRYDISFELDVTHLYNKVKENNWSFTFAMIYAITKVANEIEEFRYRFEKAVL